MTSADSPRLLVVEDDPDFASMLRLILRQELEVDCIFAEDCALAREALSSSNLDLVTLDYQLPDGDGLEILEEITAVDGHPPVIMVTGQGDENIASRAIALGAAGYVVKDKRLSSLLPSSIKRVLFQGKIERSLKESELRYRRLFESAQDGILLLDADTGEIIDANPYMVSMLGYPYEELLGKQLWEIGPFVDKGLAKASFKELQDKEYVRYENLPLEKKSGHIAEVEFVSNIYDVGQGRMIQCNIRDIGARKQAEEERSKLIHDLSERVKELDCLFGLSKLEGRRESAQEEILKEAVELLPPFMQYPDIACARISTGGTEYTAGDFKETEWKLAVSLMVDGKAEGSVEVFYTEEKPEFNEDPFLAEERKILDAFAEQLGRIIELKRVEKQSELLTELLLILNNPEEGKDEIRGLLYKIKDFTGFEAVGIRLREGEDYPYYETSGFTEEFVELERSLCAYEEGNIVRDTEGNAVLECMCGNVIQGRTDPSLPFFTKGGSFWSNNTTELLASTTEEDRQARTRNRCNGEGYESVALIPLKSADETIGLLQFNDKRKDMFTIDLIEFFEEVGSSIGIVLARKKAEDQLEEAEERYRVLAETLPQAVYEFDFEGNILYANNVGSEMFGYELEDMNKVKVADIIDPSDHERALGAVGKMYDGRSDGAVREYLFKRKDGSTFPGRAYTTLISNEKGERLGVRGILIDITEEKERENELRRMNKELEGFSRTVSHDLKGPITTVSMACETIGQMLEGVEYPRDKLADMSEVMELGKKGVERATSLISDLLFLAEAGRPTEVQPVNLNERVNEVILENKQDMDDRGIEVRIDDLGVIVANPTHMYQVFANLVRNCVRHCESDNPVLEIKSIYREANVHSFQVRDNGEGIPEDILEDIFIPFVRSSGKGDTGIGLSIVEKIVETYGGKIVAYNDNGAVFEFTLKDYEI